MTDIGRKLPVEGGTEVHKHVTGIQAVTEWKGVCPPTHSEDQEMRVWAWLRGCWLAVL